MKINVEFDSNNDAAALLAFFEALGLFKELSLQPAPPPTDDAIHNHDTPVVTTIFTDAPQAPVKRRGRPSNAEKAQRRQPTAEAKSDTAEEEPIESIETLDDVIAITELNAPAEETVSDADVTPAAMPDVSPLPERDEGAVVPLEVFREAYRSANARLPGAPFVVLKSPTWTDGADKPVWFTMDAVAAEYRERLITEWSQL